jgi:hypothetical protein
MCWSSVVCWTQSCVVSCVDLSRVNTSPLLHELVWDGWAGSATNVAQRRNHPTADRFTPNSWQTYPSLWLSCYRLLEIYHESKFNGSLVRLAFGARDRIETLPLSCPLPWEKLSPGLAPSRWLGCPTSEKRHAWDRRNQRGDSRLESILAPSHLQQQKLGQQQLQPS